LTLRGRSPPIRRTASRRPLWEMYTVAEPEDPFGTVKIVKPALPAAKKPVTTSAEKPKGQDTAAPAKAPAAAPATPPAAPAPSAPPVPVSEQRAAEVCKRIALSPAAKKLLQDHLTLLPFLQVLVSQELYADALRLLAHALPKREAVWWACRCARLENAEPLPAEAAALAAAEAWVKDPSEANRRAAQAAAETAEFTTPAGCAAIAAFWSGGSLAPPDAPVVVPGETLTAQGVANAVLLTAEVRRPESARQRYSQFITEGIGVATGSKKWPAG